MFIRLSIVASLSENRDTPFFGEAFLSAFLRLVNGKRYNECLLICEGCEGVKAVL